MNTIWGFGGVFLLVNVKLAEVSGQKWVKVVGQDERNKEKNISYIVV